MTASEKLDLIVDALHHLIAAFAALRAGDIDAMRRELAEARARIRLIRGEPPVVDPDATPGRASATIREPGDTSGG